jgi:hypothetical protein
MRIEYDKPPAAGHRTDGFRRDAYRQDGFGEAQGPISRAKEEAATVGVLMRQLGDDLVGLIQDEIALAKLEIRREMRGIGADLGKIGVAVGLALLAAQALTAFLIIGLGLLIGSFWGSALIVGALYLIVAGVLAKNAASNLQDRNPVPEATVETLQEDARWAQREVQEFKRELKT